MRMPENNSETKYCFFVGRNSCGCVFIQHIRILVVHAIWYNKKQLLVRVQRFACWRHLVIGKEQKSVSMNATKGSWKTSREFWAYVGISGCVCVHIPIHSTEIAYAHDCSLYVDSSVLYRLFASFVWCAIQFAIRHSP